MADKDINAKTAAHHFAKLIISAVFGGVDYPVDSPVNLGFTGGNMLLFDPQSGKRLGAA